MSKSKSKTALKDRLPITAKALADKGPVKPANAKCKKAKAAKTVPVDVSSSIALAASPKAKKKDGGKSTSDAIYAKQMSCLDAAAKVLGESGEPMTTGQMIEAMAK